MKRYMYWVLFPLIVLLFILFEILAGMSEIIVNWLHEFEGWCFDYSKRYGGMKHKGAGIWSNIPD